MDQRPAIMSKSHMISASERAQQRVQAWLDHAEAVATDGRKVERAQALECKACFYASRIGGQAITQRDCMSCGKTQTYGSTNTDVLCRPCAERGDLCKHCGGDREMRARRRVWPEVYKDKEERHGA